MIAKSVDVFQTLILYHIYTHRLKQKQNHSEFPSLWTANPNCEVKSCELKFKFGKIRLLLQLQNELCQVQTM